MTPRMDGPQGSDFLTGPEGGTHGFLAARGLTFDWAHADLTIEGKRFADIGVRYKETGLFRTVRGRVDFDEASPEQIRERAEAGRTEHADLANNITDPGWMKRRTGIQTVSRRRGARSACLLCARLHHRHRRNATTLQGLFSLIEEVDANFVQDRFGSKTGALLKPVPVSLFTI